MKELSPIAFFDSGYGGLTILERVRALMPEYDYLYLGDNARNPYGTRSFDVVYQYTKECVEKLFELGSPLVILACNTASAKALRNIQQNDLPLSDDPSRRVLGVIRPSVEQLGRISKTKHVGVFATQGTVNSNSYPLETAKIWPYIIIHQQACPMWVPIVENNEFDGDGADFYIQKYVDALMKQSPLIDTIILACTHYPLLLKKIRKYLPNGIQIISQGDIIAHSLQEYLAHHLEMQRRISRGASVRFLTTESCSKFEDTASIFFSGDLNVQHISLDR